MYEVPQMASYLIVIILIFLVCREFLCWYWKQNKQVVLLEEIRDLLKEQSQVEHEIINEG